MTTGRRIRIARKAAGYSQTELGEIVGVSQQMIWKLENDKAESSAKLYEIARSLGVRYDWLKTGQMPMVADNPLADATPEQFKAAFYALPPDVQVELFAEVFRQSVVGDERGPKPDTTTDRSRKPARKR